jgi:GDP-L-fucose synthase
LRDHAGLGLTNRAAVTQFFTAQRPEFVFLASAKVRGILANDTFPAEFTFENLQVAANVIHQACRAGVERLLFLGSSCAYPKHATADTGEFATDQFS